MTTTLNKSEKAALFMDIIDKMYVDGPATSPLDYSREWVDRVNRGGLFDIILVMKLMCYFFGLKK